MVGLPDAEWGQRVGAVVVANAGMELDVVELERACRAQLAGYKVLAHGTGALNIDGCRVGGDEYAKPTGKSNGKGGITLGKYSGGNQDYAGNGATHSAGRWPANLIHDGSDEVLAGFPNSNSSGGTAGGANGSVYANGKGIPHPSFFHYGDSGSAARFFYCAKASKADRDEGCEGMELKERTTQGRDIVRTIDRRDGKGVVPVNAQIRPRSNDHPTVKPTALMRYLCKLVTPPAGTVLDPFMGSGSTGKAARMDGFGFIGIEQDADYIAIARARIAHAVQSPAQQPLHI